MRFNLTTLMRLLNRLFGSATQLFTQSTTSETDYGVFIEFKSKRAEIEHRCGQRSGFAIVGATGAFSIVDNYGGYHYTPYGSVVLHGYISFTVNWATLAMGGGSSPITLPVGSPLTWTKPAGTDDNHLNFVCDHRVIGASLYEFQYTITNAGVGMTVVPVTGTIPTTGTTRLMVNLAGIHIVNA